MPLEVIVQCSTCHGDSSLSLQCPDCLGVLSLYAERCQAVMNAVIRGLAREDQYGVYTWMDRMQQALTDAKALDVQQATGPADADTLEVLHRGIRLAVELWFTLLRTEEVVE